MPVSVYMSVSLPVKASKALRRVDGLDGGDCGAVAYFSAHQRCHHAVVKDLVDVEENCWLMVQASKNDSRLKTHSVTHTN